MTTSFGAINTTVRNAGKQSANYYSVFDARRFLRTEAAASASPNPETRAAQIITWEPVILPLLERLAELRWLPEDQRWPGAEWPKEGAFLDASKFTERLPLPMRVRPHIALADDGEVNFSWSQDGMRIDLGFYGTGTFSYYAQDKQGNELFGDDISVTSSIPKPLVELMTR